MYFIEFRSSRKQELISDYLITVSFPERQVCTIIGEEPVNQEHFNFENVWFINVVLLTPSSDR